MDNNVIYYDDKLLELCNKANVDRENFTEKDWKHLNKLNEWIKNDKEVD